jgi:hypothetical protein
MVVSLDAEGTTQKSAQRRLCDPAASLMVPEPPMLQGLDVTRGATDNYWFCGVRPIYTGKHQKT